MKNRNLLNPALLERQGISDDAVFHLEGFHLYLSDLFEEAKDMTPEDQKMYVAPLVESIEFAMQRLWKFPEDANYHTHWLRVPACLCPKMDNRDPMYYGRGRIIVADCPIHGGNNA